MFQSSTNRRLIFLVALVIGAIGAGGQTYLLYHELVDCYPYKMMNSLFYENVANVSVFLAPLIAVGGGLVFGLKRLGVASTIPVILCPLVFAVVFQMTSIVSKLNGAAESDWNFDATTPAIAAQKFFSYAVSLAIIGLIIGTMCNFLLSRFSNEKKLA